jgi:hypothetical protein
MRKYFPTFSVTEFVMQNYLGVKVRNFDTKFTFKTSKAHFTIRRQMLQENWKVVGESTFQKHF